MVLEALRWGQLVAAVGIVALVVRTAHILSTGPLQDVGIEILYLRVRDLATPAVLVFSAVLLEVSEFAYPWVTRWVATGSLPAWPEAVNGLQALLLLAGAIHVFLRVREYTGPGQARHVEATLGQLAERRGPPAPAAPMVSGEPDEDVDEEGEEEE